MAKFHLKDNGDPGPCLAQPGHCPKASDAEHFSSREEAQAASEQINAELYGIVASSARASTYPSIPEGEPYRFSGESIEEEVDARGSTGFKCSSCGVTASARQASALVNGSSYSCSCSNEVTMETVRFEPDARNERWSVHRDTVFFHASPVPLETQLQDSAEQREKRFAAQEKSTDTQTTRNLREIRKKLEGTMVSEMGNNPQYAIDAMLSQDAVDEGFYVYELKPRSARTIYSLGTDDSAVEFGDPFGESDRLRRETKDPVGAFSFGSRYNDPGSQGFAMDPGTMDVVRKRWVSAEEASKSPSVYNIPQG